MYTSWWCCASGGFTMAPNSRSRLSAEAFFKPACRPFPSSLNRVVVRSAAWKALDSVEPNQGEGGANNEVILAHGARALLSSRRHPRFGTSRCFAAVVFSAR